MSVTLRLARGLRFVTRLLLGAAIAFALSVGALIAIYRFGHPVSTLMLGRWAILRSVERVWMPLESISPNLPAAVIMSEDARFCLHNGVDWGALGEVIDAAGDGEPSRGASTIAMQTAKNLFLWPSRSVIRKGIEIPLALTLDLAWPKRRIIEVYLNIAEWGDGVFGAEAAARRYFGKSAASLSPREAALLAAALPNPIRRDPQHPNSRQRAIAGMIVERTRDTGTLLDCLE